MDSTIKTALIEERILAKKERQAEIAFATKKIVDTVLADSDIKHSQLQTEIIDQLGQLTIGIAGLQVAIKEAQPDLTVLQQQLNLKPEFEALRQALDHDTIAKLSDEQIKSLASEVGRTLSGTMALIHKSLSGLSFDGSRVTIANEISVKGLELALNNLVEQIPSSIEGIVRIAYDKQPPTEYLNVRVTNGSSFIDNFGGGVSVAPSGPGRLKGKDQTGQLRDMLVVELADAPGYYGLVVANPDGTSIGTGGSTPITYSRVTSDGDVRITSSGDTRVFAS